MIMPMSMRGRRHPGFGVLHARPKVGYPSLGFLALIAFAYLIAEAIPSRAASSGVERTAAELMIQACGSVRDRRAAGGWIPDTSIDPNRTGMIGEEYGPYTTSLGDLAAKRSSTDPSFAALAVRLYAEAGAKKGDVIAIGASGSFPALLVAALAAAKASGLTAIVIGSIGSSTWGANADGFTMDELLGDLSKSALAGFIVAAEGEAGDGDVGREFDRATASYLRSRVVEAGLPLLETAGARASALERVAIYEREAGDRRIACYVNIGGNIASIGDGSEVVSLRPGFVNPDWRAVAPENRGALYEMAARGIPVIHLLNMRGLAARYSLPWDPSPLTRPDRMAAESGANPGEALRAGAFLAAAIATFAAARLAAWRRSAHRRPRAVALPLK
jgi:poly-gamma-glutamate system protein